MFIKGRDVVQRRNIFRNWPDENSICMQYKSCEHVLYPENKTYVRAETINSGHFIQQVGPLRVKISMSAQTDIKGSIPKWIVAQASSKVSKDWFESLKKGLVLYKSGQMDI